eukprot:jgi/Mesvir1/21365/Mv20849-RA.1
MAGRQHQRTVPNTCLILESPQRYNPCQDRELDLRGHKIPAIENLGATENQFDCIDLSNNDIVKLDGFPVLPRLSSLILNNNGISRISPTIAECLPNLETLILTNNKLNNLQDIDPLAGCKRLQRLCLLDNGVSKKPNYRLYAVNRCKALKLLDFKKVKPSERDAARKMFAKENAERAAAAKQAKTFVPGSTAVNEADAAGAEMEEEAPKVTTAPTPEQVTAIKAAIANAATLEEVSRLEKALKSGVLPSEFITPKEPPQAQEAAGKEPPKVGDQGTETMEEG